MTDPGPILLHERGPVSVRARIGVLLSRAATADFAVARIRLSALDLTAEETAGVRRCRVLLGRLDAGMLLDAAESAPSGAAERLAVLGGFAASGRLEVRAAGMAEWEPDFSVFGGTPAAALLGAHFFGAPYPVAGPSFTAFFTEPSAVAILGSRFGELWALGHDVLPAVADVLERAHALALDAARRRGGRDRADAPR